MEIYYLTDELCKEFALQDMMEIRLESLMVSEPGSTCKKKTLRGTSATDTERADLRPQPNLDVPYTS